CGGVGEQLTATTKPANAPCVRVKVLLLQTGGAACSVRLAPYSMPASAAACARASSNSTLAPWYCAIATCTAKAPSAASTTIRKTAAIREKPVSVRKHARRPLPEDGFTVCIPYVLRGTSAGFLRRSRG